MTENWRDKLVYWKGRLQVSKETHDDDDDSRFFLNWRGSRVTLLDCPDARCGPTPTNHAFDSSDDRFDVSGTIVFNNSQNHANDGSLEITMPPETPDWPDCNCDIPPRKRKRKDATDTIGDGPGVHDAPRVLLFDARGRRALEGKRSRTFCLVVGKGCTSDGHQFIEVGFTCPYTSVITYMLLVRRYLHDSDERLQWSLTTLKTQVLLGIPPLFTEEGPWSLVMDFVGIHDVDQALHHPWRRRPMPMHTLVTRGIPYFDQALFNPWRCRAFCSKPWRQLILRDSQLGFLCKASTTTAVNSTDSDHPPQLLTRPPDEEPFRLRLSEEISCTPNTIWKEQCWGCGGPGVTKELTFVSHQVSRDGIPLRPFNFGEYCSKPCISKAVSTLVEYSIYRKTINRVTGYHIRNRDTAFWETLNEDALAQMEAAGWRSDDARNWFLWSRSDNEYGEYDEDSDEISYDE